jgi:hypothetical protein
MSETPAAKPPAKKGADINVLRCLNPGCRALMGYEVNSDNVLYVDLIHTAVVDGPVRFFPCPKCGARNLVEEITDDKGRVRHRVARAVRA